MDNESASYEAKESRSGSVIGQEFTKDSTINSALFPNGLSNTQNLSFGQGTDLSVTAPTPANKGDTTIIGRDDSGQKVKRVNPSVIGTDAGTTKGVNMSVIGRPEASPVEEFTYGGYDADMIEGPGGIVDSDEG